MTIGDRLREWRGQRGETQDAFASLIGKHVGMVRKWESGHAVPGGEALVDIASTGVNLHWLLTGVGNMKASAAPVPVVLGDAARLATAVRAVEEGLATIGRTMPPDKRAELICAAYALLARDGQTSAQIIQFIKLAA